MPNNKNQNKKQGQKPSQPKKPSRAREAMKQGFSGAKSTAESALRLAESISKKDIFSAIQHGADAVKRAGRTVSNVVQAIKGRTNDKGIYIKYKQITPAANKNRQMAPRFNKLITLDPTKGSISRFIDVEMDWDDYTNSFTFEQMITNSYQLLRLKLKSNLPYTRNFLKAYIINTIAFSIAAKEIERDMGWRNYSSPDVYNFPEMYTRRNNGSYNGYGIISLTAEGYLQDGSWADSITNYERLMRLVSTNIRIPPSWAFFVSHYFGSVFTDSDDGYNTQYIINRMHSVPVANYDKATDTVVVTIQDITNWDINDFTKRIVELGSNYGMLISDLVNSEQYTPLEMDNVTEGYAYVLVHDKSYLQALVNGYTSNSAVTNDGYIRLDQMSGVEDDLTQYIFMGGIQPQSDTLDAFPTIAIRSMTYKIDSDQDLNWPNGIDQMVLGTDVNTFNMGEPFGIAISTDISSDDYVTIIKKIGTDAMTYQGVTDASANNIFQDITLESVSSVQQSMVVDPTSTHAVALNNYEYQHGKLVSNDDGTKLSMGAGINNSPQNQFVLNTGSGVNSSAILIVPIAHVSSNLFNNGDSICLAIANEIRVSSGHFVITRSKLVQFIIDQSSAGWLINYGIYLYVDKRGQTGPMGTTNYNSDVRWSELDDFTATVTSTYGQFTAESLNNCTVSVTSTNNSNVDEDGDVTVYRVYLKINYPDDMGVQLSYTSVFTPLNSINPNTVTEFRWFGYPLATNVKGSVTSMFAVGIATIADQINWSAVSGFSQLAALTADWFDYHLPMLFTHSLHVSISDGDNERSNVYNAGEVLVKEAYIPYFYNVKDLVPVLYDMWTSVLTPRDDIYRMLTKPRGSESRGKFQSRK